MTAVFRHRTRRAFASGSRVLLVAGPPIVAFAVATWTKTVGGSVIPWWIAFGGVVGVVLLIFQSYSEYCRRTYDPTWIFKFDERFYDDNMKQVRTKASKLLKKRQGNLRNTSEDLADIDDVLDFFEDLGFYEYGDQITPEVAHHHFYHWIRGYYLASRDYIDAWRQKEPSRWEHIPELFNNTSLIEAKRTRSKNVPSLTQLEITTFLDDEIELTPDQP
jgi:hypothetical protein